MELSEIICNIKIAQELRDAGFGESVFFTCENCNNICRTQGRPCIDRIKIYRPTATEILAVLPKEINGTSLNIYTDDKIYKICYGFNKYAEDANLADALAALYIQLRKEKLI